VSIGKYEIYRSYYNSQNHICKLSERVLLGEDEINHYYLSYSGCDLELGYYIKEDGSYLKLSKALDKNLITLEEIISLDYISIEPKTSE